MNLQGCRVLVTRPYPQGLVLCDLINEYGGKGIAFPTIAFAPPLDTKALLQAALQLPQQEALIFISPQAVKAFYPILKNYLPITAKIAAIGEGTAKALEELGVKCDWVPLDWSSEGLLNLSYFEQVKGKKIGIVRGESGRELIDRVLNERGAQVLALIAYRRVLPEIQVKDYDRLITQNKIDVIVCTSFEAVQNLEIMLGQKLLPILHTIPLVVMSERIKRLAHDLGFQTIWVTRKAAALSIIETIVDRRK